MIATSLSEIAYPVFKIGTEEPSTHDGVLYYYYERENSEGNTEILLRVIDDKSIAQPTLAKRRLRALSMGAKLFKLKIAVFFLGDLIKIATPHTWFIDSKGKLFQYSKTKVAKLKTYRIKQVIPIQSGGVIVEAEGLMTRFKSLFAPSKQCTHVGILHMGMSLVLYGFYEHSCADSWRKV